ncbi:MAG: type 4a pilus biogenesis protein PilO, partial [Candidatus Saccharibacteria bacterium]
DVTEIQEQITKALPSKPDDDQVIDTINNVVVTSATKIEALRAAPDAQKVGYMEIPLNITITGTYDSIISAVYNIESSERPIRVDSLNANRYPSGPNAWQVVIQGATFYTQ